MKAAISTWAKVLRFNELSHEREPEAPSVLSPAKLMPSGSTSSHSVQKDGSECDELPATEAVRLAKASPVAGPVAGPNDSAPAPGRKLNPIVNLKAHKQRAMIAEPAQPISPAPVAGSNATFPMPDHWTNPIKKLKDGIELGKLTAAEPAQLIIPAAIAAPATTSLAPGRRINPLASLKAHKLLAFFVLVVVTSVAAPVAWVMGTASYYTEAVVRVSPKFVKNLTEDQELEFQSNSQYREFVQQQAITINRYDIVFDALKKLGERRGLYQTKDESDRRAAERLAKELVIRPVPESYLIAIGLESAKPEGLAEVLNSVVEIYLERAKTEEFYASDTRIENIQEERKKLLQEVGQKSAQRTSLSQELGVTTFSDSLLNPYDQLLLSSKVALETARRRRIEAGAQLAALETEQQPGGKTAADAMAQEMAIKDSGLNSLKANLYVRRSQLLAKLSGLAPQHPGRQSVERELAEIDVEISHASDTLAKSLRSMLLDQRRAEVNQTQRVEKALTAEVAAESSRAMWFASRYQEALALGNEIERARKRIVAIDDRVNFLTLEANAPGFVRLVTAARTPEVPSKGGKKKFLALALLAGLAAGLIAAMAADFTDPRIHVPDELQRVLGFPPIGWILEHKDEQTRLFAHDQVMRLATSLDREHRTQGTKVLVFTADKMGEGTTSLVLGVAQSLSWLGIRALAVEANVFKPDKRYEGEWQSPGLVALLDGWASVEDVVMPGNDLLPDRISVGEARGRQPLATVSQFRHLFTELSQTYEMILLDTLPVPLSADTELLIGLSDMTLLVIEAEDTHKDEVKRLARRLERLAPPVVATILNRVRADAAGGQFAGLLKEHQSGRRSPVRKLFSPWLWK